MMRLSKIIIFIVVIRMWKYENFLEYPVNIKKPNPDFAKLLLTQIGGYSGEIGAAMRYFFQANTMPTEEGKLLLKEIATEELAHVEILYEMVRMLTANAKITNDFAPSYAEHKYGIYPVDATGNPFTATYFASTGDVIADLTEDLAAEEKARACYEHLMDLTNDNDILAPLSFLRQREIIHYTRFAELLKKYQGIEKSPS